MTEVEGEVERTVGLGLGGPHCGGHSPAEGPAWWGVRGGCPPRRDTAGRLWAGAQKAAFSLMRVFCSDSTCCVSGPWGIRGSTRCGLGYPRIILETLYWFYQKNTCPHVKSDIDQARVDEKGPEPSSVGPQLGCRPSFPRRHPQEVAPKPEGQSGPRGGHQTQTAAPRLWIQKVWVAWSHVTPCWVLVVTSHTPRGLPHLLQ